MKSLLVAHILLLIFISNAISQEVALPDTLELEEVVVTGTKIAVSRNYVPLTISVLREEEIEESTESALLPVLSARIPGLFVTERGVTGFGVAGGSAGQISIRGMGGSPNTQILVLLNGNPQYMGLMGHPLPDAYIASDVKRVEIIRGPASNLYGSNAMGGVINVITKNRETEGFGSNARIMYGSYNTQKYMLNGGYKKDGFEVFAGLNHDQTDGHRDSSDFSIWNGYIKIAQTLSQHHSIQADMSIAAYEAADPGPVEGNAGNRIDIFRGMGAIAFNNDYDRWKGSFRLFYNFGEHKISDGFHSNDNNYGIVAYESFKAFTGNTLTLGIDYKNYGGIAENVKAMGGQGIQFVDTALYELGVYAFIQQELFNRLMLNAGLRGDYSSSFGIEYIPSAGFSYKLFNYTNLKGSVSKGYRSPTIRELFMWSPSNDSLKPERMVNYELSLLQRLFQDKLSLELTGFYATGSNMIKIISQGETSRYENTGKFTHWGLELSSAWKPVSNIHFNISYSYLSMEDPIIASPEHMLYISGTYHWNNFRFNVSMQSIFNLYTQITPFESEQSYILWNANIGYTINRYIGLFLKGENLVNETYEINYGYPMPGITAFIGVNISLGNIGKK